MPSINHSAKNQHNYGHPEGQQIPALAGIDSLRILSGIVVDVALQELVEPPRDNPLP